MTKKVWFQTGIAIIITLLIIMLVIRVQVIFEPVFTIVATIFVPLLLGGLLYYITEPIQRFLEKRKAGRLTSILAVFVIILLVLTMLSMIIVPMVTEQVQNLISRAPLIQNEIQDVFNMILSYRDRLPINPEQYIQDALNRGSQMLSNLASNAFTILTSTVSVLITLVLVPFFFFFMLKDHEKLIPSMVSPFRGTLKQFLTELFYDIDHTLRAFIQGQMLVSFILCIILYIGYVIVGLDYALLLAIFALFMNLIPFIGPWIAFLPAALLAVIQDPFLLVWVSLITLIAQQIESNLITPNVMGQTLKLHPLTVITVVLAAGNIAGFIGMLIAIPTYAVVKTIIQNMWRYRSNLKETMFTTTGEGGPPQ
ncbi:AI-2E family transporter [Salinicoccus cyprini]|uniref:AI-2E family transporter n=1 Tax=Salinicoccus cyprini TaxID=2493691 RepID=A0A558AX27_9STAP|nr:AI-2E family transporter [Salinicoccus cyprini]TVT28813.1 AI-2E family transporter [Salinicoccus cyprini]